MDSYSLEAVLNRVAPAPTQEKTAAENDKSKDEKDPVEDARKEVSTAVDDLKDAPKSDDKKDDKEENGGGEKTAASKNVEKLANDLLDADADSMMKLAFTMGGAFEEGRLAQASVHAQAANELEDDQTRPKTAEEAQQAGYHDGIQSLGAVIDVADHSYNVVMADREKMAAAVEDRGYRQAKHLFSEAAKTA